MRDPVFFAIGALMIAVAAVGLGAYIGSALTVMR